MIEGIGVGIILICLALGVVAAGIALICIFIGACAILVIAAMNLFRGAPKRARVS